jgi:hypothetical protein
MSQPSDYVRLVTAYHSFKLLAARLVEVLAIIYGAIAWKPYFLILGTAGVVLFWVWDRMIAAEEKRIEEASREEADAP